MPQPAILVVDDDPGVRKTLEVTLTRRGWTVVLAESMARGLARARKTPFDLIFCDIMLGDGNGLDLVKTLHREGCPAAIIMMTGNPALKTAQEAIRQGAFDYLEKPTVPAAVVRTAESALRHKGLQDEKESLRRNLEAVFHSVASALVTVSADGQFLAVNEAAETICGWTLEQRGKIFPGKRSFCGLGCRELWEEAAATKQPLSRNDHACRRRNRPEQIVHLKAAPLRGGDGIVSGAVLAVEDATRLVSLERDLNARRGFHRMIGASSAMQEIYRLIEDLSDVDTTVLIVGESGSGKELAAEAVHYQGVRAEGPLVKINCSALPETLLESELFGHVKGAFTGAVNDKEGRFQRAEGGTLFLDEIGDISPLMQVKLLRVLQEKSYERVGESTPRQANVRLIAATNRDLGAMTAQGTFREDLLYRLKVVQIRMPPLRERMEDLPLLCDFFIKRFSDRFSKSIKGLSEATMRSFMGHVWPGNVRELEHALEHAFVVCRDRTINAGDLPSDFGRPLASSAPATRLPSFNPLSPASEREAILTALEAENGRREPAAKRLGMSRATFFRRLKKYGISR